MKTSERVACILAIGVLTLLSGYNMATAVRVFKKLYNNEEF